MDRKDNSLLPTFTVEEPKDTSWSCLSLVRGAFVNGRHLGRFLERRPRPSHFISLTGYLKEGANRIIIFETEGEYKERDSLTRKPTQKTHKGKLMTIVGCRIRWTFDPVK